jgi:hypothetical protein
MLWATTSAAAIEMKEVESLGTIRRRGDDLDLQFE